MRVARISITVSLLATALFTIILNQSPTSTTWQGSYQSSGVEQGGSKAVVSYLTKSRGAHVQVSIRRPLTTITNVPANSVLLIVDEYLSMNERDAKAVIDWVRKGGHLYIAAHSTPDVFDSTFGYAIDIDLEMDDRYKTKEFTFYGDEDVSVTAPSNKMYRFLVVHNRSQWKVLATSMTDTASTVIAERNFGRGTVTICTIPVVFSNYSLLQKPSRALSTEILNRIHPSLVWLDYRSIRYLQDIDAVLLEFDSWRYAWNVLLASSLIYVLITARRRQRIIPEMKPAKNTTLEFAESVAELYWKRHDNTNLGRKISRRFREHVRRRIRVTVPMDDAQYVDFVADATGRKPNEVYDLVERLRAVDAGWSLHDEELQTLFSDVKNFIEETP